MKRAWNMQLITRVRKINYFFVFKIVFNVLNKWIPSLILSFRQCAIREHILFYSNVFSIALYTVFKYFNNDEPFPRWKCTPESRCIIYLRFYIFLNYIWVRNKVISVIFNFELPEHGKDQTELFMLVLMFRCFRKVFQTSFFGAC